MKPTQKKTYSKVTTTGESEANENKAKIPVNEPKENNSDLLEFLKEQIKRKVSRKKN